MQHLRNPSMQFVCLLQFYNVAFHIESKFDCCFNTIFFYFHSYDVILLGKPEEFLKKFLDFKANMVFSAEGFCWPDRWLKVISIFHNLSNTHTMHAHCTQWYLSFTSLLVLSSSFLFIKYIENVIVPPFSTLVIQA